MATIEELEDQLAALERSLDDTSRVVGAFEGQMRQVGVTAEATQREVGALSNSMGRGLRKSFEDVVFDGARLSDALRGVAENMAQAVYRASIKPVEGAIGGVVSGGLSALLGGLMPFASGGAFSQGRVMPFAKGGVVSSPVTFPMRGATGLMGEAGPEAIMPLTRGADGRLGVQAAGGGRAVNIVMNVSTPDVQGFQRSQGQIAAQVSRALSRGQRNK
ncbi:phage tail tape measure protein [Cereibacter sp. SYSU M97828]|nr:phage tail tape measure protein [Cereibacter flavus]